MQQIGRSKVLPWNAPLLPYHLVTYQRMKHSRFQGTIFHAAQSAIPRGFCPTYIPCLSSECQQLVNKYESSADPDVADHLITSFGRKQQLSWTPPAQTRRPGISSIDFGFSDNYRTSNISNSPNGHPKSGYQLPVKSCQGPSK